MPQSGTTQNIASYTKGAEIFSSRYTEAKPCKVFKFFLFESVLPSFLGEALTNPHSRKRKKEVLLRLIYISYTYFHYQLTAV